MTEDEIEKLRADLAATRELLKEARLYVESFQGKWGEEIAARIDALLKE